MYNFTIVKLRSTTEQMPALVNHGNGFNDRPQNFRTFSVSSLPEFFFWTCGLVNLDGGTRVTRLGELSPTYWVLAPFWQSFINYKSSPYFWAPVFHGESYTLKF
jgi:hypothetical protein